MQQQKVEDGLTRMPSCDNDDDTYVNDVDCDGTRTSTGRQPIDVESGVQVEREVPVCLDALVEEFTSTIYPSTRTCTGMVAGTQETISEDRCNRSETDENDIDEAGTSMNLEQIVHNPTSPSVAITVVKGTEPGTGTGEEYQSEQGSEHKHKCKRTLYDELLEYKLGQCQVQLNNNNQYQYHNHHSSIPIATAVAILSEQQQQSELEFQYASNSKSVLPLPKYQSIARISSTASDQLTQKHDNYSQTTLVQNQNQNKNVKNRKENNDPTKHTLQPIQSIQLLSSSSIGNEHNCSYGNSEKNNNVLVAAVVEVTGTSTDPVLLQQQPQPIIKPYRLTTNTSSQLPSIIVPDESIYEFEEAPPIKSSCCIVL